MPSGTQPNALYENFGPTSVDLWPLLRDLSQRGFIGRVHVDSADYSADVFLNGSNTPLVHEIDRVTGIDTIEEGALYRVVLRTRETPGTLSVHEGVHEATPHREATVTTAVSDVGSSEQTVQPTAADHVEAAAPPAAVSASHQVAQPSSAKQIDQDIYPTGSFKDWPAILATAGELIRAVERAITASGENFQVLLNGIRVELSDDYSFLDPITGAFAYGDGVATLKQEIRVGIFVAALSETLRRIVNRVAVGERSRRIRERVALELLTVARAHAEVLDRSGFQAQLDRIAGTRVR
ncbi:MAG: hypothetical protein ABR607_12165 [Pyrinomonadaceae bacterium]